MINPQYQSMDAPFNIICNVLHACSHLIFSKVVSAWWISHAKPTQRCDGGLLFRCFCCKQKHKTTDDFAS